MESLRRIQDSQILEDQGWRRAAQELLSWNWDIRDEISIYGQQLADCVVKEQLRVDELKEGVVWATAHFLEAKENLGSDWSEATEEDLLEATARKLALGAGHRAYSLVFTESRFAAHKRDYRGRLGLLIENQMFGLGRLEAHDLGMAASLVNINAK